MSHTVQSLIDSLRKASDDGVRLPNLVTVARGLGLVESTIREAAEKGRAPAIKIGSRWKSTREVLQAWRDGDLTTADRAPAPSKAAPAASVRKRQLETTRHQLKLMGVE